MNTAQIRQTTVKTSLLLLLVTSSLLPKTVLAQSSFGLSAIPPRLEIVVEPGEHATKEIKVRNESKTEKFITVNTKDFIVKDNQGTPIPLENVSEKDNRWAASSWIQVSPSKLVLKPGETKSLMLTVVAPENALPGGHYAMVLHTPTNDATLAGTGAAIEANVGSLVYVTVPGDIKQNAQVKEFAAPGFSEYGPIDFKSTIENLSDVHITPRGQITVKNMFGTTTAQLPLEETNIFPYTERSFENLLDKKWLFGRYQAQLNAAYGTTGGLLTATVFFWVIPWKLITFALALVALFVLLFSILRNKGQGGKPTPPAPPTEPDLENLKNKYRDKT